MTNVEKVGQVTGRGPADVFVNIPAGDNYYPLPMYDMWGEVFTSAADPVVREALGKAVPAAQKQITGQQTRLGRRVHGWEIVTSNIGNYGTDYLTRACVELIGLGANLAADAIYPAGPGPRRRSGRSASSG